MSDEHLRELERQWKKTGAVDDEAAYLLERIRVGDLDHAKLELAAFVGHEGARVAAPSALRVEALTDNQQVTKFLAQHGREALVRGLIASARHAVEFWANSDEAPSIRGLPSAQAGLWAIEEWAVCPCDDHLECATRLGEAVEVGPMRFGSLYQVQTATRAASAASLREAHHEVARLSLSHERLREVGSEIALWALGYSDVVRRRVEARQQEAAGE